ncbi:MAG: SDR family NAD(P)-dependent oxidoreductase, partial [Oceanicaulis sp.]
MTKAMALSLAPWGVRVNAIGPGSINTEILKSVADDKAAMKKILSRTPLNRIGDPDEIAGVAWFLASKDSSYVTGECVYADGGRLALNYVTRPEDYED